MRFFFFFPINEFEFGPFIMALIVLTLILGVIYLLFSNIWFLLSPNDFKKNNKYSDELVLLFKVIPITLLVLFCIFYVIGYINISTISALIISIALLLWCIINTKRHDIFYILGFSFIAITFAINLYINENKKQEMEKLTTSVPGFDPLDRYTLMTEIVNGKWILDSVNSNIDVHYIVTDYGKKAKIKDVEKEAKRCYDKIIKPYNFKNGTKFEFSTNSISGGRFVINDGKYNGCIFDDDINNGKLNTSLTSYDVDLHLNSYDINWNIAQINDNRIKIFEKLENKKVSSGLIVDCFIDGYIEYFLKRDTIKEENKKYHYINGKLVEY